MSSCVFKLLCYNYLPLLLSKSSMKRAEMVINLKNDSIDVFGKTVRLNTISLGHYLLPIYRCPTPEIISEVLVSSDITDVNRVAFKIHRQFAHRSS